MSRLFDRILAAKPNEMAYHEVFSPAAHFAEYMSIDNVARYFFDHPGDYSLDSFPNVAPPFNNFFLDFQVPKTAWDNRNTANIEWGGVHLCSIRKEVVDQASKENPTYAAANRQILEMGIKDFVWWIFATGFIARRNIVSAMPCLWIFPVKGDGLPCKTQGNDWAFVTLASTDAVQRGVDVTWLRDSAKPVLYPALLAVSFMHCKNVTMERQTPPVPLSRKFQKKSGRPLARYYVLNIEPMRKILRAEGQSEKTGLKQALHICRGHFKDYSKGGGLFGKFKGLYWWDSQVRGSVESGIVDKDYRIKGIA